MRQTESLKFWESGIALVLLVLILQSCQVYSGFRVQQVATGEQAMIVSPHPLSSLVGVEILKKGGNAVDAAVAMQFAMAVVYPRAGNIGGGGFMVVRSHNGDTRTLDYREKAPLAATRDMYLDSVGNVVPRRSIFGHLAAGVPGTVDGLAEASRYYGHLPWREVVQPAIRLARRGMALTPTEAARLSTFHQDFLEANTRKTVFAKKKIWVAGDTFRQVQLARTLARVKRKGRAGFYEGRTAKLLLAEMERGGGIIAREDLESYSSKWRPALTGTYKNLHVFTMPPPSSGGVALLQMLRMAERFPLSAWGADAHWTIHTLVEIMRRVYADRAEYLGDSDFHPVPVQQLLDSVYLASRMRDFHPEQATPSDSVLAGKVQVPLESFETTHICAVDRFGMAVSATTTLNSNFGSKVVVGGAGFLLNNEMDDFSVKPGVPNQFGLVGAEANAIAPGKRMLSSMTPTIVERDGKLHMLLGTPGGSTIMTAVLEVLLNVTEFGLDLETAIEKHRFHHQWLPDEVWYEAGRFDVAMIEKLTSMGHHLKEIDRIAKVKAIQVLPDGRLLGVGDYRLGEDDARGY
jgi:gamma-glutamyltranspeptidase/glutathione hydrolase